MLGVCCGMRGFGRSGWFLWGFWCAQGSVSQERNWDAERAGVEHALSCSRITTQTDAPLCKTYSSPVLCALLDINQFWWNVLKSLLCWKLWCNLDTGVFSDNADSLSGVWSCSTTVYQEPRHKCMFGTHLFCGGNACGDSGRNWKSSFRIAPSAGMLKKAFDDLVHFQFPSWSSPSDNSL